MNKILAAALVLASTAHAWTPPQVPVVITADFDTDSCGSGTVLGLDPHGDGFLAVKSGPGIDYDRIDKLYNGENVALCAKVGPWFGIVYTKTRQDCNVHTGWSVTAPYTGPCRSGWVHEKWIGNVAG